MTYLEERFKYPRHKDFFVVAKKEVILKPRFAKIVEEEPHRRGCFENHKIVEFYTEKGILLYLPDGPRYRYQRDERSNCVSAVHEGQVVSANINKENKWALSIWPVSNETFFKDIPEIDNLIARVEKAHELGHVQDSELERVMPFIKNQRIAHEILNELMKQCRYRKRDRKVEVHARRCPFGGPNSEKEPLDYTIFCYVGEAFYRRDSGGPYQGKRIAYIKFEGWDLLHTLAKEKVLPNSSQKESRKEQDN